MTEELYMESSLKSLDLWMSNREKKKVISQYLETRGIYTIGIYGYGLFGKHLVTELQGSNIDILWIMDKKEIHNCGSIPTVHIDEVGKLEQPDLVIVTSIRYYEEIENDLFARGLKTVRGIDEIIEVMSSWKKD